MKLSYPYTSFSPSALVPILLLMLVSFVNTSLHAQHTSDLGRFELDRIKGCAPLRVTFTPTLPACPCDALSCPCEFDYLGDGGGFDDKQNTFSFTYTTPGVYRMAVFFNNQIPRTDSITVTVTEAVPPAFELIPCIDNEVSLVVTDMNYERYAINFGDGTPGAQQIIDRGTAVPTYSYSPGTYTVSVNGLNTNAFDNCPDNSLEVMTLDTPVLSPPLLSGAEVVDATSTQLFYEQRIAISTQLEISTNSGSTFSPLQNLDSGERAIIVNGLDNENNSYCFRAASVNRCDGTVAYSETLCTPSLDIDISDKRNTLTWTSPPIGVDNYTIERNGDPSYLTVNSPSHDDIDVICGTEYCYRIIYNYTSGAKSWSLVRCISAISTERPPAVEDISIQIEGRQATLDWTPSPMGFKVDSYSVFKRRKEPTPMVRPPRVFTNIPSNNFNDFSSGTDNASQCYSITYRDICGNAAPEGIIACSLLLVAVESSDGTTQLIWNPYEGWANGVSKYIVDKLDINGSLAESVDVGLDLSYTAPDSDEQSVSYRIRAVANDVGISEASSNIETFRKASVFTVPNSFSPNGDGINDTFSIISRFVDSYELRIFNRWGQLIHYSDDLQNGWDGSSSGKTTPEGTYAYVINGKDKLGKPLKKSGTVLLLRN